MLREKEMDKKTMFGIEKFDEYRHPFSRYEGFAMPRRATEKSGGARRDTVLWFVMCSMSHVNGRQRHDGRQFW